jgi:hypothetical protein
MHAHACQALSGVRTTENDTSACRFCIPNTEDARKREGSFCLLNVRQHPCFIQEGLFGGIETKEWEPGLPRQGLDPVFGLVSLGLCGADIELDRSVIVFQQIHAGGQIRLFCFIYGDAPGGDIVDGQGPRSKKTTRRP